MRHVVPKVYNFKICNSAGTVFNNCRYSEEVLQEAIDEFVATKPIYTLKFLTKSGMLPIRGTIESIEIDNITFKCNDPDTMVFLNEHEDGSVCIMYAPLMAHTNDNVTVVDKMVILDFIYVPVGVNL